MNLEDYSKYYIQGSDHYLIPKDDFVELFNEMLNWKEESIELNKKYVNAVSDYETTMFEKEQLKKHLEVPETCNLKTLEDYKSYYEDTTREQILVDTYIKHCAYVNLAHGYSKLEKQLEDYKEQVNKGLYNTCLPYTTGYNKAIKDKETQQKEFIKYLEDEIKMSELDRTYINGMCFIGIKERIYKNTLSKYKEIIGDEKWKE